ncbi:MAG: hypothetical protein HYR85_03870 [Planctomycetes bacterium]|nr:hypothetical protein [Planctomycetota bacterium]MBI3848490.1 hypothetical protein [Planctomycetota bacterium]
MATAQGIHDSLLDQARHLATRDPKKPNQANLRRAVSTAYYAVFHLLVRDATRHILRGRAQATYRARVARAFGHADLKRASLAFIGGNVRSIGPLIVPPELVAVSRAVVDLQDARHLADYDLSRRFDRSEVLDFVEQAASAFRAWAKTRRSEIADLYLTMLLIYGRLAER